MIEYRDFLFWIANIKISKYGRLLGELFRPFFLPQAVLSFFDRAFSNSLYNYCNCAVNVIVYISIYKFCLYRTIKHQ